jgi:hypothetical protein
MKTDQPKKFCSEAADARMRPAPGVGHTGFIGLKALPSISLLGPDHDGIMDDDLFEMLNDSVESKAR